MADDDISALIEALRPVKVTTEGAYRAVDRYRDFHSFFATEGGKRVLAQIVDLCEGRPVGEDDAANHAALVWRAARRDVGLKLLAWATVPPRET